ncbi:YciI family protein [Acidisoma cladoniae]|jgi:uncharacterized protein YciI|uniref:YciI family protein n=1 Tax=Acidisoma cladoniae TaxID=3040935 RepID=UPI002551B029|nr:YciI family protein [Acidisoma sp. PAMC 29798]
MNFTITNMDKPDSFALRAATREMHLGYLDSIVGVIVAGGAFLNAEGKPIGSLLIVEAPDQEAAQALAAEDPYARAGLFATMTVSPYRLVYKDGARVA